MGLFEFLEGTAKVIGGAVKVATFTIKASNAAVDAAIKGWEAVDYMTAKSKEEKELRKEASILGCEYLSAGKFSEIINSYKRNVIAADNEYKGKNLLVVGKVVSINYGSITIRNSFHDNGLITSCSFNASWNSSLAGLKLNDSYVQVKGKFKGHSSAQISLVECSITRCY